MLYADFHVQGLFVRQGVMEVGYKPLVGKRLSQRGMFWPLRIANSMIVLWAVRFSN